MNKNWIKNRILYKIRKLAELVQKDYGRCRYMYRLTGPNRLESWFLLTTRFKDNRFDAPFQNRVSPVSFSFYLQRMTQFGLKLQIASWFAVVRSRNSSSYSLGTVLHPRPPRHSRLSDVRNKERLKHKGCSVRDIQANPAVNAMEQESLWTRTSLEEQSTCSRHNQSRPEKFSNYHGTQTTYRRLLHISTTRLFVVTATRTRRDYSLTKWVKDLLLYDLNADPGLSL